MFGLFNKNKTQDNFYFGLILRECDGVGLVLQIDEHSKHVRIIDEKKFEYTSGWERIVEDVDGALSYLESKNKIRMGKIIFFMYSHMVDQLDKQVKPVYLNKIKKIARELSLKPLGYIAYHEALVNYLRRLEETPLTSIIIELDKNSISLFVYKGGVVTFSDEVGSTDNLLSDLEVIFTKASKGNKTYLPSRMILYDSTNIERESTKIITHQWNENIFIQIPRVEIMTPDKIKNALIGCFTEQLFDLVTKSDMQFDNYQDAQEEIIDDEEDSSVIARSSNNDDAAISDFKEEKEFTPSVMADNDPDYDSSEDNQESNFDNPPPVIEKEEIKPVSGFSIGEDVLQKTPERQNSRISENKMPSIADYDSSTRHFQSSNTPSSSRQDETQAAVRNDFDLSPNNGFEKMFSFFKSIFSKFSIPNISLKNSGIVLPAIIGVILIGISIFSYAYFFHKADVAVYLPSQKISKIVEMDSLVVAPLETEVSKTLELAATGKKTIGEKGKGSISISSLLTSDKLLKKGTVLTVVSSTNKFVLDSEVTVPARTGSMLEGNVAAGKIKTSASAVEIGTAGNISKDTKLQVDEISSDDMIAVVDVDFSGGVKKDIQVASRDDYARLRAELMTQFGTEASQSAKTVVEGKRVVPDITNIEVMSEEFTKEIGQEATVVALTSKTKISYYSYAESDIKKILGDALVGDVQSGYELKPENISYTFMSATYKENQLKAKLDVSGKALMKIDINKLNADILGKNDSDLKKILEDNYRMTGFKVDNKSGVLYFQNITPYFLKNINLRLESN